MYKAKLVSVTDAYDSCHGEETLYAIKKINLQHKSKDTIKEVFMLKNIAHPNIIKCHTSFVEDNHLHIVMEYAKDGDLFKLIENQRQAKRFFAEKTLWKFAWQIC